MVGTWLRGLLALACLIAVTGCGSGSLMGHGVPDRVTVPDTPLPTPRAITRLGETYRVAKVAPQAVVVDRTRPRDLQVAIFQMADDSQPACAQLSATAQVAEETDRAVFIAAFAYGKSDTDAKTCSYTTSGNEKPYTRASLHLRTPVGDREIIDVKSGKDIAVAVGQEPPAPSYVPGGYTQGLAQPFDQDHYFLAIRQFRSDSAALEIRLRSASVWQRQGTVVGRSTIDDHEATVSDESWQRCVTWSDDDHMVREVCSLGLQKHPFLAVSELERIARSLPS